MNFIKKEEKQSSLIHQKIRNAAFVPIESYDTEKFKYNLVFIVGKYFNKKKIALERTLNTIIQKPRLYLLEIDFKAIKSDLFVWLTEALIEGFVINFILWALIEVKFTFLTMTAYGFAIKQLLSIYWRLRKDGANSTIPKKNK
jgi:hypothetical protein